MIVVDLDKSKNYPLNFVCILPRTTISLRKHSNIFSRIFGSDSLNVAKQLLRRALKREKDTEIKKELKQRLKALKPTLTSKV
jgi:hypothetical protein